MSRRDREELLGGNNIIDEVDDIEFGERRSRRNTSIQYRDSSSLTPLQFMERDVYYHYAIMSLGHSCCYLRWAVQMADLD